MQPLALIKAMRPHQWVKNVFVLAALLFWLAEQTDPLAHMDRVANVLLALAAFCLGSSTIYLINDVMDVAEDRRHPTKCKRPIAAGLVTIPAAIVMSASCFTAALLLGYLASRPDHPVVLVVGAYMAMNFLYSWKLKHVVLVDAFCIATGFMLRVVAGAFAAQAEISHWLILCTLFLALFLALCKRRAEIDLLGEDRGDHRKILLEYTPAFLDQTVVVLAACAIINYTMYTVAKVEEFGQGFIYTVPFVVFGLFRYLLLVQTQKGGGSPTRMLLGGDAAFVANCVAWLATVMLLLFSR